MVSSAFPSLHEVTLQRKLLCSSECRSEPVSRFTGVSVRTCELVGLSNAVRPLDIHQLSSRLPPLSASTQTSCYA